MLRNRVFEVALETDAVSSLTENFTLKFEAPLDSLEWVLDFIEDFLRIEGFRVDDPPWGILGAEGGLFPPDLQQSLPPQHAHGPPQGRQGQQPSRPPMMRSATEHDIKIRNRRSMAVGPFEDLPPHIRQHMVSLE